MMPQLLDHATEAFIRHGLADPEGEARRLALIVSARQERTDEPLLEPAEIDLEEIAAARAGGTPLEYCLGVARFCGRLYRCDPRALIPREETELLARTAARLAGENGRGGATIVDIGTGSGNLAITLAHEVPGSRIYASDITDDAVSLARTNVGAHGLEERVSVHRGSLFEPFEELDLEGAVDMVVCNPPYIPTASLEKLAPEIRDHEPREAFDGGGFGIDIFRGLIDGSERFLRSGGTLVFEIGAGQERLVKRFLDRKEHLADVQMYPDAAGTIRVISARRE